MRNLEGKKIINIQSRLYWVKVVGMLEQNWALIEQLDDDTAKIYFAGDNSGVFDEVIAVSKSDAEVALKKNGFSLYQEGKKEFSFLIPPEGPFWKSEHPNGNIYSSGKYWI